MRIEIVFKGTGTRGGRIQCPRKGILRGIQR